MRLCGLLRFSISKEFVHISPVFGQDLNGIYAHEIEFRGLNLKKIHLKIVLNNIDSSVNKLDLNEGYGVIEQYRYVSIRMEFEH